MSARCAGIRSRGISGERACLCCSSAASKAASRMGQLVLHFLTAAMEGKRDVDLVLDPQTSEETVVEATGRVATLPKANPVIRGVPSSAPGSALGLGAVVVLLGLIAEDIASEAKVQTLASQLAEALPPMVGAARKYAEGDCEACVRRGVWGQQTPRVYVTERHQTRTR